MNGSAAAWASPHRKRRRKGGGVEAQVAAWGRQCGAPVEQGRDRPQAARPYMSCSVRPASAGVWRTTETKRAASSEWPPRSVKKSASNGIACGGSTRLAAASRAASVGVRGSSWASVGRRRSSGVAFEPVAVDLAGRQPRQGVDRLEARRHHIGRQRLAQRRAQAHSDRGRLGGAPGTRKATSWSIPSSVRSTTAACATPGSLASFASISPSSTRKPRIFT